MSRVLSFFVLGLLCQSLNNPETTKPASSVRFQIRNAGIIVKGSFSDIQPVIHFDPAYPEASSLAASVGAATIRTGIALRDAHLQNRGYFDTQHYPRIKMVAKRIQKQANTCYVGLFDLTIRAVTKPVEVPFCYVPVGTKGRLIGQFRVNRQDFGLGNTSLVLSDEVTILIDVETDFLIR